MLNWLSENAGTLSVALILCAAVAAVIVRLVRDRKKGKSSCGCGCEHCAMASTCHKAK